MEVKITKRSYYLPAKLMELFNDSWAGRDYSTKIAGAICLYLLLKPSVREQCEKAAFSTDIEKALKKLGQKLPANLLASEVARNVTPEDISFFRREVESALANLEQLEQKQKPSRLAKRSKNK